MRKTATSTAAMNIANQRLGAAMACAIALPAIVLQI
jgi:hypothetical protein